MASHVPFLAVRPDDQFSTDVRTRDFAKTDSVGDAPEAPMLPVPQASRLPGWIKLPLVVLLSLGMSTLCYTLVADWAGLELATVSRELSEEWQIAAVLGWKIASLTFAYASGYDWLDLSCLTLLSNLPYYYLLNTFYILHDAAVAPALAIDVLSVALPFFLFRRTDTTADAELMRQDSRAVAHNYTILALVTAFGSTIYALTIYTSFYTWLPVFMINHYDNLRTVSSERELTMWVQVGLALPAGLAATRFLFMPAVSASNKLLKALDAVAEDPKFDPEVASLSQTIAYNLGFGASGFSVRTQVLTKRTAVLVFSSAVNTFVRVFGTVEGAEVSGAAGWSSLWAVAGVLTGVAFGWVADE